MKKAKLIILCILAASLLSSCGNHTATEDLGNYSSGKTADYVYVSIDNKVFVPFSAIDNRDRGKQIGIVDGDKKDKIYEYRDYSPDEWIVNFYESGLMDGSMLMREETVSDIPEGLQSEYEWNN